MSAQSKATDISPKVRATVMKRDGKRCVICGSNYMVQLAHVFVNRSHGGLGVERNLVSLCIEHHRIYDNGKKAEQEYLRKYVDAYMTSIYGKINIQELKYKKYM